MGKVILYHTVGCHLCEVAEQLLQSLQLVDYERVDIATQEALVERYGIRIPVVRIMGDDDAEDDYREEQELGWPFTLEQLTQFLAAN